MDKFIEFLKYKKIIEYLNNNTNLLEQEIMYLFYVLDYYDKEDDIDCFLNCLIEKYNYNYNIIKNSIDIVPLKSKKDFINLLSRKKSIFLFEEIDLNNLYFYLIIWENLHS